MTMTSPHLPVAVLGLGALGSALARALLAAGHPTTVWNRTPARTDALAAAGAAPAPSPAEAVRAAEVVVVAVADADAVRAVLGPVAGELAGRVVVVLTSGTPEQARELAAEVRRHGAGHLDGAAMSGVRLVGSPEAVVLYSGSAAAFATAEPALRAFGGATHLGEDPGIASLYDTALLGMNMSVLASFSHALALVGSAGVAPADFAAVATGYLPFALGLLAGHATQVEQRRYPADEGTLDVLAAALDHLVATSARAGVRTDVADALRALVGRGIAAGHGQDGPASLAEVLAAPVAVAR
jgi:3-hydroxyisobutyrate dehydrogenase-like beta-hydroxyacid dehydrogenase